MKAWIRDVEWFEWGAFAYALTALAAIVALGHWAWISYNAPLVAP